MLSSSKIQNGGWIQDGRQNVLSFKACKVNYFLIFLQDCLNLPNCSSYTKKNFNMADFLLKNPWFFGSGTAGWNVLIFGYVILLALFYCKKNLLPLLKNQNEVYIQDGVENVYIFHPIFSKMIFLLIFLLFFYILGKNKTFMENLFSWKFKIVE
jgi:hypothetical protein